MSARHLHEGRAVRLLRDVEGRELYNDYHKLHAEEPELGQPSSFSWRCRTTAITNHCRLYFFRSSSLMLLSCPFLGEWQNHFAEPLGPS